MIQGFDSQIQPEEKDDLQKGFYRLFESMNRDDKKSISVHMKKGSEIKGGLKDILTQLKMDKSKCIEYMTAELGHLKYSPDKEANNYALEGLKHRIDYIPKKFSYDMINHGEMYVNTDGEVKETSIEKPTQEEKSEMREYNRYVDKYVELCISILKIKTLHDNISDSKAYQLDVDQLAMLGL